MALPSYEFYKTPDYSVARNYKAGSSSVAYLLYHKFIEYRKHTLTYVDSTIDWQYYNASIATTYRPETPVHMFVRDPVKRFISGCSYVRISPDAAIESLVNDAVVHKLNGGKIRCRGNPHFFYQHPYSQSGMPTKIYKFPEQIDAFCSDLEFGEFPKINPSKLPKWVLTQGQISAINEYYREDMELWDNQK